MSQFADFVNRKSTIENRLMAHVNPAWVKIVPWSEYVISRN
jgi:hypothetical protein